MDKTKLDLILEKWIASLKFKDRSFGNVANNFEELFEELKVADATFEEAHAILAKAIKAHLPAPAVARNAYKSLKAIGKVDLSFQEYIEEWHKSISDVATDSFYVWYPIETDDEDKEPPVYGNMSVKEYRKQRAYADSFPTLDTTELETRMKNRQYNLDIEDLIENILGNKDETNS